MFLAACSSSDRRVASFYFSLAKFLSAFYFSNFFSILVSRVSLTPSRMSNVLFFSSCFFLTPKAIPTSMLAFLFFFGKSFFSGLIWICYKFLSREMSSFTSFTMVEDTVAWSVFGLELLTMC